MSERLHPEGAPGVLSALARQMVGDAEFERSKASYEAREKSAHEYGESLLVRAAVVNAALALLVVALVAVLPAVVIVVWRWAL